MDKYNSLYKNWLNKFFVILLLMIFFLPLCASRIDLKKGGILYPLLNRKTNKIINYYELMPGKSMQFTTFDVDSLSVYSRVIISGRGNSNYNYQLKIADKNYIVNKSAGISKITRGLNGDKISAYNQFKKKMSPGLVNISIINSSKQPILFKVSANNVVSKHNIIDYIRYTPDVYGDERTMMIDDKEITYYSDKDGVISLVLEGPIVLKIMSRFVFSENYVNSKRYRFHVFNNGKLIGEYQESASKSNRAYLFGEDEKMLSTADANILKLSAGIHRLSIENKDKLLDVIFRLYISKTSIEIEEK